VSFQDQHHRRVHAGAETLDLSQLKLPSLTDEDRDGCGSGTLDDIAGAGRRHGVVPQTCTWAFLPTGANWNMVL